VRERERERARETERPRERAIERERERKLKRKRKRKRERHLVNSPGAHCAEEIALQISSQLLLEKLGPTAFEREWRQFPKLF
jgi:hypothetical protein